MAAEATSVASEATVVALDEAASRPDGTFASPEEEAKDAFQRIIPNTHRTIATEIIRELTYSLKYPDLQRTLYSVREDAVLPDAISMLSIEREPMKHVGGDMWEVPATVRTVLVIDPTEKYEVTLPYVFKYDVEQNLFWEVFDADEITVTPLEGE